MSSCRLTLCGKWQLLLLVVLPPLHSCVSSWVLLLLWLLLLLVARAVTVLNELSAPCCGATVFNVHSPQIRFADPRTATLCTLPIYVIVIDKNCGPLQSKAPTTGCLRSFSLSNAPECACSMSAQRAKLSPPTILLYPTQITELILLLYMKLKVRRSCGA